MKQPYSTCLVPTYAQLEQEVKALRAEAAFYKEELENLIATIEQRDALQLRIEEQQRCHPRTGGE